MTADDWDYFTGFTKKFSLSYYEKFCAKGVISFDDLVQEGYVGLYEAIAKYDPSRDNTFRTYACSKISYAIIEFIRKEFPYLTKTNSLDDETAELLINESFKYDPNMSVLEQNMFIKDLLTHLDYAEKLIIFLVYYDDYTIREVADIIDKPKSTVSDIHQTILTSIRDRVNKLYESQDLKSTSV